MQYKMKTNFNANKQKIRDMLNKEAYRYERKFVIKDLNLHEIQRLILIHPSIFSETFSERRVNNLYLDSMGMENYLDNVEGNSKRLKIRIRWYGDTFGLVKNPVLEIKFKEEELGKKLSFPLKAFYMDEKFSSNLLQRVFVKSELPDELLKKINLMVPTLLNSYKRKYFISANKLHRITLDKNLIFFKINKQGNNKFLNKIIDDETFIFELKCLEKDGHDVEKITNKFPFRLNKSSKYVSGIELIN